MKCLIHAAVLLVAFTSPMAADPRTVKRELIRELLEVIDARSMAGAMVDLWFDRPKPGLPREYVERMSEEDRKQHDSATRRLAENERKLRERVLARMDNVRFAEEVFAPMFDRTFTAGEIET